MGLAVGERGGIMFNFLKCKFGLHKLVPLDLGDMNYKDEMHGWIEQDVCIFCGYKTSIREYYQKGLRND